MIQVYVVTHKFFDWKKIKGYTPIAVGKELTTNKNCSWLKDNTLENISDKNQNYCELTAQYWIWKNDNQSDIKGLCHYRRYLSCSILSNQKKYILTQKQIERFLKKYDVILPFRGASIRGNLKAYCDSGFEQDIFITRDVVKELYPEYLAAFNRVFDDASTEIANMMITSRKIFDDYSKWLFDILFEVENRVDLNGYSVQQARIFGYISERLLDVWLTHHGLRIKRFRILNTEKKYGFLEIAENALKKTGIYYLLKKYMLKLFKGWVNSG